MTRRTQRAIALFVLTTFSLATASCGVGGTDAAKAGQGLVLLTFLNDGVTNTPLNRRLEFHFSENVRPDTIDDASIQIREGPSFGATVEGVFVVEGHKVFFEPRLAGLCDHSDSGLKPDTQYRVQAIGHPEEFAVRNQSGQPLRATETFEFHTRMDNDPLRYEDQVPGAPPFVLAASTTPLNGDQAVDVAVGTSEIRLPISENLNPCTVSASTVRLHMHQTGNPDLADAQTAPNGNLSGFYVGADTSDKTPLDHPTWGASDAVDLPSPQRILVDADLRNTFHGTELVVRPQSGTFPENALLVLELTFGIEDYGNEPLEPFRMSFTTENLDEQHHAYALENEGETPWDDSLSTAEINTARSASRVQGFMLFAGDGDNGANLSTPSLPEAPGACLADRQINDGTKDDFDPDTDTTLDTGASDNTCQNSTDGSTAVIWEFSTFHIRSGVTVRIVGVNPAIILVQGDATIDSGGRLSARSDNAGGSPRGNGQNGYAWTSYSTVIRLGGIGVAGAGSGGDAAKFDTAQHGGDGYSAFGSVDGRGMLLGEGAGQGGTNHDTTYPSSPGTAQGGGGGGHAEPGGTSTNVLGNAHTNQGPTRGAGGAVYPTTPGAERMLTPSAGAGGGAGGNEEWDQTYDGIYSTGGGAGGAGGGFVDITSSGDISIYGTIDVSGSAGGNGGTSAYYAGPGGGGGGAGGGIRLLTPNSIILGSGATITAAGGAGGNSPNGNSGGGGPQNHGAAGANGRIVMEDGDSVITGIGGADVTPGEGDPGFNRGQFDPTRFKGGGLTPQAVSSVFPVGGLNPKFKNPVQVYGTQEDFMAGIPVGSSTGSGRTAILIEARGFQMKTDGLPDLAGTIAPPTPWLTVGHFTDSGVDNQPTWNLGQPTTGPAGQLPDGLPADNGGFGIAGLDSNEFVQLRITVYLSTGIGPQDPGPFVDRWDIRFSQDQ